MFNARGWETDDRQAKGKTVGNATITPLSGITYNLCRPMVIIHTHVHDIQVCSSWSCSSFQLAVLK